MNMKQAREYLQVSDYLLRKLARKGNIPCLQLGTIYYFRRESLEAFITAEEQSRIAASKILPTAETNQAPGLRRVNEKE
jgi:excisionase family DNA binding protein